jgi:hypothetical protein
MHRVLTAFTLFVAVFGVGSGCLVKSTSGQQKDSKKINRTADVDALIASVSAAPPEFSADLLIRIALSKLIDDKEKKADLLEDAFRRSSDAQQKVRLKMWAGPVDTRSGYLSAAYDLRLDALSLKSRVVKAMVPLDARRARMLFNEIPKLKPPSLSCSDTLGYEFSEYYQALQAVEKGFSPEERKQGENTRLVQSYIDDVVSPAQVGPVVNLVADLRPPAPELSLFVSALSARLKRISEDPRSYALSMRHANIVSGFEKLISECKENNVPTNELLSSLRSYVISQLSSVQCSDTLIRQTQEDQKDDDIAYVSKWFKAPIRYEDVKPAKVDPAAALAPFWTSTDSAGLLMKVKALRFGSKRTALSIEDRNSPEWQQNFLDVVNQLENWDGGSEKTESDYFNEKCNLYGALFDLATSDDSRVRVLLSYANYLRNTGMQDRSRIEWMLHANYLLDKMGKIEAQQSSKMLDIFKSSGNATLQLYAALNDSLLVN